MADIETVIKGLNDIGGFIAGRVGFEQARNFLRTIEDAIDMMKEQDSTINELQNAYGYLQKQFFEVQDKLLKEQEAVKPGKEHSSSGVTWWNVCGNCKTAINPNDKFCHECGKQVRWE